MIKISLNLEKQLIELCNGDTIISFTPLELNMLSRNHKEQVFASIFSIYQQEALQYYETLRQWNFISKLPIEIQPTYVLKHPTIVSCKESEQYYQEFGKQHPHYQYQNCKNLVLADKKEKNYFLLITNKQNIDFGRLKETLGTSKLHFVTEAQMKNLISCKPGSVSILSLLYDSKHLLKVLVDANMKKENIAFHPSGYSGMSFFFPYSFIEQFLNFVGNSYSFIPVQEKIKKM